MRFLLFFLCIFFPFFAFAQEERINDEPIEALMVEPVFPQCQDAIFLTGPSHVKMNSAHEFGLSDNNGIVQPFGVIKIEQESRKEEFILDGNGLNYSFSTPGIVKISFIPKDNLVYSCIGEITKEIHVFREKIAYIGIDRADVADHSLAGVFREKSVLLEPIFIDHSMNADDQGIMWNAMGNADIVVINYKNVTDLFPEMEKLQKLKENNFAHTKFFIISHHSRTFLAKILAKSVANLGIKNIYLISEDQLSTLLGKWSYENNRSATLGDPLLYEKNTFSFTMNHFLEYLVYSGVSYQFLGFLLLLSFVALVLNIFKQIVGLDTFSLYYPLLFGIIIAQIGFVFTAVFALFASVSWFIVQIVTRKIPLLVNAKKAFLISVYVLFSLAMLGLDNVFEIGIFHYSIFQNSLALIAIFGILLIIERLFDSVRIFSKTGFWHMIRYVFILIVIVAIFASQELKYFLISYPDIIFLIVIANLLVGRYTGLQVAEYFRFSPILKNINEEE